MSEGRRLAVGVDGYPVSGRRSGIGRYVAELLMAAGRNSAESVEFTTALCRLRRRRAAPDLSDLRFANIQFKRPPRVLWELVDRGNRAGVRVPFDLLVPGQDVHFFTRHVHYATRRPVVSMVYDLSFCVAPDTIRPGYLRRLRRSTLELIQRSDVLGVISHTLAAELGEAYPETIGRTVVLRPGRTSSLQGPPPSDWRERLAAAGLVPGYFLHVGTLEPRKNLARLLEAIHLLGKEGSNRLVLVGQDGWDHEELLEVVNEHADLFWIPSADDTYLRALYEGASLLVFPSLYEGFGLPVLEAMSLGVPVACSDLPVLREVAGDAARYFDPLDVDSIGAALGRLVSSQHELGVMAERGRERSKTFSWDSSADSFVNALRGLVV